MFHSWDLIEPPCIRLRNEKYVWRAHTFSVLPHSIHPIRSFFFSFFSSPFHSEKKVKIQHVNQQNERVNNHSVGASWLARSHQGPPQHRSFYFFFFCTSLSLSLSLSAIIRLTCSCRWIGFFEWHQPGLGSNRPDVPTTTTPFGPAWPWLGYGFKSNFIYHVNWCYIFLFTAVIKSTVV